MTKEEHIENLKAIASDMPSDKCSDWIESLMAGVKALSQEPCEDVVSRQTVNELVDELARAISDERCCISRGRSTATIMRDILHLPSVTPHPKMGKWFIDERPENDRKVVCSNCDQPIFKYHKLDFDYRPKYCPNCGSKNSE